MLKTLRAEHILAIILTGIFLVADVAVLCFFVSAFDPNPQIAAATTVAEHHIIQTPALSVRTLISMPSGTSDTNSESVQMLEEVISSQLKVLTDAKTTP